jgi:hypothetical protein
MSEEEKLQAKLRAVEALFAGTTHEGERDAAGRARERIIARLTELKATRSVEWRFSLDSYTRHLLIALARRYGLQPYRYHGQRRSTLIIRAPESFLKEVFLPEYDRMVDVLHGHLMELTKRVVAEALHGDQSEPAEEAEPRMIQAGAPPKE